jgi:Tfp pilus assembly protein PilE
MRFNENGRSMIEMLGVLAIVGVLSVGGIAGYSKAMDKYKTNQLIAQITEVVIGVRTLFTSQKSYAGISIPALLNTGAIPAIMRAGADESTAHHALGGQILIFPSTTATQSDGAFELYLTGVSESACKALVSIDWSQETSSGFMSMFVGSGYITDKQMEDVLTLADSNPAQGIYTAGSHDNGIPLSVAEAAIACDCPDIACTIGLKYR